MELISGGNFSSRIGQTIPKSLLLKWLKQLSSALVYMHGE
jgi:serine/threonine protein kinase